jgi:Ras-related protein Rab-5C
MASAQLAGGAPAKKYKLVLLGDSGVGKSCLVVRLCKDEYVQSLHSTVGSSFFKYSVNLDDGSSSGSVVDEKQANSPSNNNMGGGGGGGGNNIVHFDIWDTAGQERFKSLARMYYRGAAAILVVYDITSLETFERAKLWVKELSAQETAVITLVGNKVDLDEERAVSKEEAAAFAAEVGIQHAEASAKTGGGVKQIFFEVAKKLASNANKISEVRQGGVRTAGGTKAANQNNGQGDKKPCAC